MATARRRIHGEGGKPPDTMGESERGDHALSNSNSHPPSHGIFGRHSHEHDHGAHGGGLIETLQGGGAHSRLYRTDAPGLFPPPLHS
jgi:hypothetical protein